jgi:hypothetical protein
MNKIIQKCVLFLAIPCILLAAGYCALMYYYKINIPYGTWVNDIYCTGMSYEEVADKLLEQDQTLLAIDVIDKEGNTYHLVPERELYMVSYTEGLGKAIASYGAAGLFTEKHITHAPIWKILSEKWESYFDTLEFVQMAKHRLQMQPRMEIIEAENGYVLLDHLEDSLDIQKASEVIVAALEAGEKQISLLEAGCYFTPDYILEDREIIAEFRALEDFCKRMRLDLTIQGKMVYTIDWKVLKDWILRDENGDYIYSKGIDLMLDEAKVKEYVSKLDEELTSYWGRPWQFVDHNGETIEVKAGNFGRVLKTALLTQAIFKAYEHCIYGSYELEFVFYPKAAEKVDFSVGVGTSYVEVDIEEQHIYVYMDGECVLDSPCVTGNVSWNMETPKGVFYIEYKQRNRTLRGPDYATPVSYWMHFYNHCGFHDAYWRRSFGGEIYLKDGSHGCVNMPPTKAKELYELVYAGMPVVIY